MWIFAATEASHVNFKTKETMAKTLTFILKF